MGLTIHYQLSLPGNASREEVRHKLDVLRRTCLDLPFKELGEIVELKGNECDFTKRDRDDPLRWMLVQAQTDLSFIYTDDGKPRKAQKGDKNVYAHFFPAEHLIGFSAWPGPGCEQANIGLCQFQKTVAIPYRIGTQPGKFGPQDVLSETKKTRLELSDGAWSWHSFCKTQYANEHCLENFLRCHLTVIAMLDAARKLGFAVEVKDEGQYWEKRDVRDLAKQVGDWDAFLAAFAGALKDSNEDPNLRLEAPITERKDFEQLEAKGQSMLPANLPAVLKLLVETTAKHSRD